MKGAVVRESDLRDACELILEPVYRRLGEPPILRDAIDQVYSVIGDHMTEADVSADMHMELLRELEELRGA